MNLGALIAAAERIGNPQLPVRHDHGPQGVGGLDSYRGYYDHLALDPGGNWTVGTLLAHLRASDGATFRGYKGGDYTMSVDTPVWLSPYGEASHLFVADLTERGDIAHLTVTEVPW